MARLPTFIADSGPVDFQPNMTPFEFLGVGGGSDSEIPNLYLLNPNFLKMNVSSRSPGKILMPNFEIPTIIMLVPEISDLKMVDPGFPKRPFSSQYSSNDYFK